MSRDYFRYLCESQNWQRNEPGPFSRPMLTNDKRRLRDKIKAEPDCLRVNISQENYYTRGN